MYSLFRDKFKRIRNKYHASQQSIYLRPEELLEEKHSFKLLIISMLSLCAIVLAFLIWASITHINEIAVTMGEVVPKEHVSVAQHLEGGIIRSIHINNGDEVKAGQLLVKLDPAMSIAELEKAKARELSLLSDASRLMAYTNKGTNGIGKINFHAAAGEISEQYKSNIDIEDFLNKENLLLHTQEVSRKDQQLVIDKQIKQQREELRSIKQQKAIMQSQLELIARERDMSRRSLQDGVLGEAEYLHIQREYNQINSELIRLTGQERKTRQAYQEAVQRAFELDSNLQEKAYNKLVKVTGELLEVRQLKEKLKDRVRRLNVVAPISGVIQGLEFTTGSVVQPGETILEIIPDGSELLVDTKISTKDIGHVHLQDQVKVKIFTYDYSRYGYIPGYLESVSASTFVDEENETYYKGKVRLQRQYAGVNSNNKLKPGMSVQADIITGDKTLLQYILKPIHIAMNSSFSER